MTEKYEISRPRFYRREVNNKGIFIFAVSSTTIHLTFLFPFQKEVDLIFKRAKTWLIGRKKIRGVMKIRPGYDVFWNALGLCVYELGAFGSVTSTNLQLDNRQAFCVSLQLWREVRIYHYLHPSEADSFSHCELCIHRRSEFVDTFWFFIILWCLAPQQ